MRWLIVPTMLLVGATNANAAQFSFGVAAGDITSTSALLWARAGASGRAAVELLRGGRIVQRRSAVARRADDNTVRVAVTGLRPGTAYSYRFRQGRAVSARGSFQTAPARGANATIEFAFSGDADATPRNGRPAFNQFQVYAEMAAERNHFNVNLGDTIYSDSEVGGAPVARTVAQKWAKYRQNLALPALRRLRTAAATYSHWDDHEFINDFTLPEHGDAIYRAGRDAFLDYAPVRYGSLGLYRSFRWGRHVELFFLDERSFRSAKASAEGACGTPPDLAPTAPTAVRSAFSALAPPLARPVPPGCLERIRDPARTMLGAAQLDRFVSAVLSSTATWKVVMNEVPIQQFYANPYDRWEGYEAERRRLLEVLRDRARNVVFLTTDTHAHLVGDVRLQTFESPGPVSSGITEVVTGPVATNTFAREVDATLGAPGTGQAVAAFFLKPSPPRGIGMRCVALDAYGYAQVRVTSTELRVELKDLNGEPIRDVTGDPCAPVVLTAR